MRDCITFENSPSPPSGWNKVVSPATVFRVVTQRSSPTGREALRDGPNDGCGGDYGRFPKNSGNSGWDVNGT